MTLPVNPYIAGNPVRHAKGFFGRRDLLDWVSDELLNPSTDALVIFGQRRIGKTSLLLHLQRTLPKELYFPVYFDLQDQARLPLGEVLAELADTVTRQLKLPEPDLAAFDDHGRYFRRHFLPKLYQALDSRFGNQQGRAVRPVLLLDEFEVLDQTDEDDLAAGSAARALHPFLRKLMHEEERLAFVFATGRSTEDLSGDVKMSFKGSLQKTIWVLDEDSARDLVRQAEANGTLHFNADAIRHILALTSCHPYLTQLLCQRIWQQTERRRRVEPPPPNAARRREPSPPRQVGPQQAERAVEEALEVGDNALVWIWDGLAPAEKVFAAAAGMAFAPGAPAGIDAVLEVIGQQVPHRRSRDVEQAAESLVKGRILRETPGGKLAFEIELFRRWVHARRPLRVVEDELDRLKPEAEAKYTTGERLFRRKQWRQASVLFRDALDINPRHQRAHLLLGESLLHQGLSRLAVEALEEAYRIEPTQARLPLVRALTRYASEAAKVDDEGLALQLCEQALKLSPTEPEAKRVRSEIWSRRGELALRQKNLDRALECFRQAESSIKVAQIEEKLNQRRAEIQTVVGRLKTAVEAALAASSAAESEAATTTAGARFASGVWWGAARIFREEGRALLPLHHGIEALRNDKPGLALRNLREVPDVRPVDERNDETLSLIVQPKDPPMTASQALRVQGLAEEHRSVLAPTVRLAQALRQAIADCDLPQVTAHGSMSLEAWDAARKALWEKERAARRYVEGIRALQQSDWSKAQQIFGFGFTTAPEPGASKPGEVVPGSGILG